MQEGIEQYIIPGKRAHLCGIGGISMRSLAEALLHRGLIVTGSDRSESPAVDRLRRLGIPVTIGHFADPVYGADCVIRTAAVHDDNPEIIAARAQGIPVFERAQAIGFLMKDYRHAVAVAGTHGKTTTTSMTSCIALADGLDPTILIGGVLPLIGSEHRIGHGDVMIMEACEYCNSFLHFAPTIGVILNVDADHMDFFHSLEEVKQSFRAFAELVPSDGVVIYNADDPNTVDCLKGITRNTLSFGIEQDADVQARNIKYEKGLADFTIMYRGEVFAQVRLLVPGKYNVLNALAAVAAAIAMGIEPESVVRGLQAFAGTQRRFELKGQYNGALIYDDYAHHPQELHALFDAVQDMEHRRVIAAFQPHTYTRTKAFFEDFVRELSRPDITVLAEIYAAREQNTEHLSSADLAARIPGAVYCKNFDEMVAFLKKTAQPGDLILTIGAGELDQVAERLARDGE